jgi:hypothetical protein
LVWLDFWAVTSREGDRLRIFGKGCGVEYFTGGGEQEDGENCIMSFIICTPLHVLLK